MRAATRDALRECLSSRGVINTLPVINNFIVKLVNRKLNDFNLRACVDTETKRIKTINSNTEERKISKYYVYDRLNVQVEVFSSAKELDENAGWCIRRYAEELKGINYIDDKFLPFSEVFEDELINSIVYAHGEHGLTVADIKRKIREIEYESTF